MKTRSCIVTLIAGAVIVWTPLAAQADSAHPSHGNGPPTTPTPTSTEPEPTTPATTPQPPPPAPTAPKPSPQPPSGQTTPSQSPWSNCSVTSAGLVCPGATTTCMVTSAGVTCPLNCAVASARSSSCPQGTVAPNPRGEVLAAPPTFGGQKKRAKHKPNVPRNTGPAQLRPVGFVRQTGAHELPFTGLELLPLVMLGLVLIAAGLVLRRGTSASAEAALPAPAAVDPTRRRPPGIAAQALVLVACGLLLRRRSRH
jgi:hypothetical protein